MISVDVVLSLLQIIVAYSRIVRMDAIVVSASLDRSC
jgi:hypothetical protein